MTKQKLLVGMWNLDHIPLRLGGLLIFIEELLVVSILHDLDTIDICFIGTMTPAVSTAQVIISSLKGINKSYYCQSEKSIPTTLNTSSYERFLISEESTRSIQKFYSQKGYIPYLSSKDRFKQWTSAFIKKQIAPCFPVVVHLKNSHDDPYSNADFVIWEAFFTNCQKYNDTKFILIGSEEVPNKIRQLPNICIARDFGSTLSHDLALIQAACLFMGMSSGPCNMAIFSPIPYIIYKDPNHHQAKMKRELGDKDHFRFAQQHQKFFRGPYTAKSLLRELQAVKATFTQVS